MILVSMAVARLATIPTEVPARAAKEPVRAALVVGAGSLGRAAAVELGERGIPTYLVDHASPAGSGAGSPRNITLRVPSRVMGIAGGAGDFTAILSELGGETKVRVGAILIAPGLAEEQRETAVGWGLPHQSMMEPPRRVAGTFLVTEDSLATAGALAAFLGRDIRGAEAVAIVDPQACIGCLKCEGVCPYSAIEARTWDMGAGPSSWLDHIAHVDPFLCAGCGACTSACLNWAIDQVGFDTKGLEAAIRAGLEGTQTMLMVCNWAAYRALDRAYLEDMMPKGLAILRLPCMARLSPHLVQVALGAGADPLIIAGCSERGCHYRGRRAMVDEHLRDMEVALSRGGYLERVFVLALGPTDRDVLATRVTEAIEERRFAREDRDVVEVSELRSTDWSRGWG
jgi:coenzyme F420-reducing hydrogenase delta subunit/NAD-dependent dihydropyrimidine dehydrogenase PreA subunit